MARKIQSMAGEGTFNLAGKFKLDEFVKLINKAPVIVSVNTGTVHIAAATGTPTVVLYALTNPQHTPWMVPSQVLSYAVPPDAQSKNEVIAHVSRYFNDEQVLMPCADEILAAVTALLNKEVTEQPLIQLNRD